LGNPEIIIEKISDYLIKVLSDSLWLNAAKSILDLASGFDFIPENRMELLQVVRGTHRLSMLNSLKFITITYVVEKAGPSSCIGCLSYCTDNPDRISV